MTRLGPIISNHGKVVSLDAERFKRRGPSDRTMDRARCEAGEMTVAEYVRRVAGDADDVAWRMPSDTEVPFGEGA